MPAQGPLPSDAVVRGREACARLVDDLGLHASIAIHVPTDGGQGVLVGAAGGTDPFLDIARGLARRAARDGRALVQVDSEIRATGQQWRHAAVPVGSSGLGTIVVVASDPRMAMRDTHAIAAWLAPPDPGAMRVAGGSCTSTIRRIAQRFSADTVVLALFAQSGITLHTHVRSGALLQTRRVPADTVWGEVARHGAAFTLGDLHMHAGVQQLGSIGMRSAGLVGLENGSGLAIGALGVAAAADLRFDVAHELLAIAPALGPEVMARLSSTRVPVPDEDGAVDLRLLAARVGCQRFAMYELEGTALRFVVAHGADGSRLAITPDDVERDLVVQAVQHGVGALGSDAAAVLVGDHTVLYAHDPDKRALDCLRRALEDVRRNPFGAPDTAHGSADAA